MQQHDPSRKETDSEQLKGAPSGFRPWQDHSLPAEQRFDAYKEHVSHQMEEMVAAMQKLRNGEFLKFETHSAMQKLFAHAEVLSLLTTEEYCRQIERPLEIRKIMRSNFLGAEEWRYQGVNVGAVPEIPSSLTRELLESDCPLHPGEKIKDTHLLVLVPETLNGEPCTALKLHDLCQTWASPGGRLIKDGVEFWEAEPWTSKPQAASEWVLIPKDEPDFKQVPVPKHFREKGIAAQQEVQERHYPEYREAKAIELMVAALLHDLINGERLLEDFLRCQEPNALGGRACIGLFSSNGMRIFDDRDDGNLDFIGSALARHVKP